MSVQSWLQAAAIVVPIVWGQLRSARKLDRLVARLDERTRNLERAFAEHRRDTRSHWTVPRQQAKGAQP